MPDIVSVEYQQTGNSTSTNPYGMREMQERAFEYRDAQYMLLKVTTRFWEVQSLNVFRIG